MYSLQQKEISTPNKTNIITSKEKTYTNSNEINNNNYKNVYQSGLSKEQNNSLESKLNNNNINMKNKYFYTIKKSPLNIKIEYENSKNNNGIINEENGNFNVYFMKPDFRKKTFTTIKKSNYNNYMNDQIQIESKKQLTFEDDNDNPYNDNSYNYQNQEPQFQQKDSEIMPLEIIHYNNEKKFKLNLIQKLKSFKMNQVENKNEPLNIAAKLRNQENLKNNSMKYLLAKLSEPIDYKKELMYYKGYFRFWKRKTKKSFEPIFRRRIKKDRNIRITTVIYKADIPKKVKNKEQQLIIEKQQNENEKNRKHLILNLEKKIKEKLTISSNNFINNIINNINNEINISGENVNNNNENIFINDSEQNEQKMEFGFENINELKKIFPKNKVTKATQNIFSKYISNKKNKNKEKDNININNEQQHQKPEQQSEFGFENIDDLKNILPKNKVQKATQNIFSKYLSN